LQGLKLRKPENLTQYDIRTGQLIRTQNALTHKSNEQATELAVLYMS